MPPSVSPSGATDSNLPLFSLAAPARKLAPGLVLTLLVVVALVGGRPYARVAHDGCSLIGAVAELGARHDSFALAEKWGQQLNLGSQSAHLILAAEFGEGALAIADCVRVVALPVQLLKLPGGACASATALAERAAEIDHGPAPIYCELAALVDSALLLPCAAAFNVISSLQARQPRAMSAIGGDIYSGDHVAPIGRPVSRATLVAAPPHS